jgi:hypothetical protein
MIGVTCSTPLKWEVSELTAPVPAYSAMDTMLLASAVVAYGGTAAAGGYTDAVHRR